MRGGEIRERVDPGRLGPTLEERVDRLYAQHGARLQLLEERVAQLEADSPAAAVRAMTGGRLVAPEPGQRLPTAEESE